MKRKSYLFLLLISFYTLTTFGQTQQTDSLLQLANRTNKAVKQAKYLNALGNLYRYSNTDSAYKYILKAQKIGEQNKLTVQLAESYNELGIIWKNKKETDSAFYYLNKGYQVAYNNSDYRGQVKSLNSMGLYKTSSKQYDEAYAAFNEAVLHVDKINDQLLLSTLYNSIAILHKRNGDTDLALENYHKALHISEAQNLVARSGIILSNIGLLYETQNKTDLALEYLNRSLDIRLKQGNRIGESYVRTNLGVVYENLKEYDKALEQYRKSLVIKKEINSKKSIAILYNNIGIIYKKQALYDSAYYYCSNALDIRIQLKDKLGEARAKTAIGQIYYLQNNYTNAEIELNEALLLVENSKNYTVLQNIYASLYNVSAAQNNYKNAVSYLISSQACKDSIFNIRKENSIADIETKYNTLQKEKENLLLSQANELKDGRIKLQILIGAGLVSLIFIVIFLLFFSYRSKHKLSNKNKEIEQQSIQLNETNKKLKQLSEFKEAMTNMLVHDLKTPLNVFLNIKALKDMASIDDLVLQSGYNMQNLVNNILDVYKYQNTKLETDTNTILLSHTMNAAFEQVSFLITQKQLNICIKSEADYQLNVDEELFKRVLINLLSNAIKFTPEKETITLSLKLETHDKLRIGIANPGPGIPKEKQELIFEYFKQAELANHENIKSTGLGLTFCKLAIEAHKGEIGVISETENGVEFWFTLPKVIKKLALSTSSKFI